LGTATLNNGAALLSTVNLAVGSHSLTAAYAGDSNNFASTSNTISETINAALPNTTPTTTTLSVSPEAATVGKAVILTATVTPASATGTVTFMDGSAVLGVTSTGNGNATFATSSLATGSHMLTASYDGNTSNAPSTSSPVVLIISKLNSSTALTLSTATSTQSQAVTLTAAVSPSSATGNVTFLDGQTIVGTANLSAGVANFTTSSLAVGSHSLSAVYGGDTQFNSSSSSAVNETVSNGSTIIQPTCSPISVPATSTGVIVADFAVGTQIQVSATGEVSLSNSDQYATDANGTITKAPASGTTAANFYTNQSTPAGQPPLAGNKKFPLPEGYPGDAANTNAAPWGALLGGWSAQGSSTPPTSWFLIGSSSTITPLNIGNSGGARLFLVANELSTRNDNSGAFIATPNSSACATFQTFNSASFQLGTVAQDSIATLFGKNLAPSAESYTGVAPTTLGGASVQLKDSTGVSRLAPMFFASDSQINFLIPAGTAVGPAAVTVIRPAGTVTSNTTIAAVYPGIYTVGATTPAAFYLTVPASGTNVQALVFDPNTLAPIAIPRAAGDATYLLLFGTGVRHFSGSVTATVAGQNIPILGAVAQPTFAGLDQINIGPLPANLPSGSQTIQLTVDGVATNTIVVRLQ